MAWGEVWDRYRKSGANKLFNKITFKDLNTVMQWANRRRKMIENGNAAMAEEAMKTALWN